MSFHVARSYSWSLKVVLDRMFIIFYLNLLIKSSHPANYVFRYRVPPSTTTKCRLNLLEEHYSFRFYYAHADRKEDPVPSTTKIEKSVRAFQFPHVFCACVSAKVYLRSPTIRIEKSRRHFLESIYLLHMRTYERILRHPPQV